MERSGKTKIMRISSRVEDAMLLLSDEDSMVVYHAIAKYAFHGRMPIGLNQGQTYVFNLAKKEIDLSATRGKSGSKGGAPKGNKNACKNKSKISQKASTKQPKAQANSTKCNSLENSELQSEKMPISQNNPRARAFELNEYEYEHEHYAQIEESECSGSYTHTRTPARTHTHTHTREGQNNPQPNLPQKSQPESEQPKCMNPEQQKLLEKAKYLHGKRNRENLYTREEDMLDACCRQYFKNKLIPIAQKYHVSENDIDRFLFYNTAAFNGEDFILLSHITCETIHNPQGAFVRFIKSGYDRPKWCADNGVEVKDYSEKWNRFRQIGEEIRRRPEYMPSEPF